MRRYDEKKKATIAEYIDRYYGAYGKTPSLRDIAAATGIATATVHRYLLVMKDDGSLSYNGRKSVKTECMRLESTQNFMPVLGFVACGDGQEEEQQIIEYIRMPESLVGKGEFFALITKGESMVDAGICPGDYVIVRKQDTAEPGDIIVAFYDGRNNLKVLGYDRKHREHLLISCNKDQEAFAPIRTKDLKVQGVAVCVTHKLGKVAL